MTPSTARFRPRSLGPVSLGPVAVPLRRNLARLLGVGPRRRGGASPGPAMGSVFVDEVEDALRREAAARGTSERDWIRFL